MYKALLKKIKKTNNKKANNGFCFNHFGANWGNNDYYNFAKNGYIKNVVVNKSISMIAKNISSIPFIVYKNKNEISNGSISYLFKNPNPMTSIVDFIENLVTCLYIHGNAYINFVRTESSLEMYVLRPDRVKILTNNNINPSCYSYSIDNNTVDFIVDEDTFESEVCHIKFANPIDDWYGLSPIEAAQYSMEQHNKCIEWNKCLLENGARPTGALMMKNSSNLSEDEFDSIKEQIKAQVSGSKNAGNIMLLEGGFDWKEMSISPKDMDFIETKNSAARDIALAFNIPPQLLGLAGDSTYNNLKEARMCMWEEVVIPVAKKIANEISRWINTNIDSGISIDLDYDKIQALSGKREALWGILNSCTFLTDEEKREMLGFSGKAKNQ